MSRKKRVKWDTNKRNKEKAARSVREKEQEEEVKEWEKQEADERRDAMENEGEKEASRSGLHAGSGL